MSLLVSRRRTRWGAVLAVWAGCAGFAAAVAAPLAAASVAERATAPNARVLGTFAMTAHVTAAVQVTGEHVGQTLHRSWRLIPSRCDGDVCRTLTLLRDRSANIAEKVVLHRTGSGRYTGQGAFYVGLSCLGKTYPDGSHAPFQITLTVKSVAQVEQLRFATRIAATYVNSARTDATPCPLGPSHDAARYTGMLKTAVPLPPVAAFAAAVNGVSRVAAFVNKSTRGAAGEPIVRYAWNFGDPASGVLDTSTAASPDHQFSAPGTYTVTLTATDSYGLTGVTTETVIVPPLVPVS